MECVDPYRLDERDLRFLEYRLDVINSWPQSPRKQAAAEAISRRLASIARGTLFHRESGGLLATSCRLLDNVFSDNVREASSSLRLTDFVPPDTIRAA